MDYQQGGSVPFGWYLRGESADYSGTEILTLVWTLSSVGGIVLTLRGFSQLKFKGRLELDDHLMIICWVSRAVYTSYQYVSLCLDPAELAYL